MNLVTPSCVIEEKHLYYHIIYSYDKKFGKKFSKCSMIQQKLCIVWEIALLENI